MVSPIAGTRAPTFQHQAGHFLLSPSELTKPKVTWLVNARAQHCPSDSHLLEKEGQGQPGSGSGQGKAVFIGGAWLMLARLKSGPEDWPLNVGSPETPTAGG